MMSTELALLLLKDTLIMTGTYTVAILNPEDYSNRTCRREHLDYGKFSKKTPRLETKRVNLITATCNASLILWYILID